MGTGASRDRADDRPRRAARVPPSRTQADRLVAQAHSHLTSAAGIAANDPEGGYALAYDAARKALSAILENQGLRAMSRGGHLAVHEAVRAQLDPPMGKVLRAFNHMRRLRNDAERGSARPGEAPNGAVSVIVVVRASLESRIRTEHVVLQ